MGKAPDVDNPPHSAHRSTHQFRENLSRVDAVERVIRCLSAIFPLKDCMLTHNIKPFQYTNNNPSADAGQVEGYPFFTPNRARNLFFIRSVEASDFAA
jgi:hypothetical protein